LHNDKVILVIPASHCYFSIKTSATEVLLHIFET